MGIKRKNKLQKKGFTLVEILVSVLIFSFMATGFFLILSTGQSTWYTTDVAVRLQQSLRQSMQRVTKELHESGFSQRGNCAAVCKVIIQSNAGINGTDILSFQVPIDLNNDGIPTTEVTDCGCCPTPNFPSCNCGRVIDWGAPLLWADKINNCGGGNNHCQYPNYSIKYLINDSSQFVRQVLDAGGSVIRTDIFADNLTGFHVTQNGNVVSIQLTAQLTTVFGRNIISTMNADALLRNRG